MSPTATAPATASGTVNRDELVAWVDDLLDSPSWRDFGPNGLQVQGADDVATVAVSVSSSVAVFERAAALGADMVIVHHGLFWDGDSPRIGARMRRRLDLLLRNDISLAAWHLPLDAHVEVGNNALLLQALGATPDGRAFGDHDGRAIGAVGTLGEPCTMEALLERVATATDRTPLHLGAVPPLVRSIAICSGGAGGLLDEAVELGVDAFLTGEPKEGSMAAATESEIAFIAAGHYATETFGVRALGERLAVQFGVRVEFVDVPNPV